MQIAIFWFRRDLRTDDNTALFHSLECNLPVLPIFIFDENIIDEFPADDPRLNFIYDELHKVHLSLTKYGGSLNIFKGDPVDIWKRLLTEFEVAQVFSNKDYEPYARKRDAAIEALTLEAGVKFKQYKDQVIFEESEIVKADGSPYTVFTPYMKKWKAQYAETVSKTNTQPRFQYLYPQQTAFPEKKELGIKTAAIKVRPFDFKVLNKYAAQRNIPAMGTTDLGPHLRFGTVSIRKVFAHIFPGYDQYANELIWREFFMQILFHFPESYKENFRSKYDQIAWKNDEKEFEKWCNGETGYPIVDAGMRQLNETGYMHGRVRMITASFLVKHLLIDWRWGEAYFAQKLLDFEMSSNVGNWQWVAGTGCDAAPYFRIFNPTEQQKKFDSKGKYVRRWVKDINELTYPSPMINHQFARERCLNAFRLGIASNQF